MNISMDTTTHSYSTTERDACITDMLDDFRGMLFNMAHRMELEFEDCLQEAALILLEKWDAISKANYSVAYACVTVRETLPQRLHRTWAFSLDKPVTADSNETYAGTFFAHTGKIQPNEKAKQVVHAALHQCDIETQRFARDAYGLDAFEPRLTNWRDKPLPKLASYMISNATLQRYFTACIHGTLKMDTQVQAYIQRETCVL